MMNGKKQHIFWRGFFYLCGVLMLSVGVTLCTRSGLGISPITSLPYAIANALGVSFPVVTGVVYCIMVACQFCIRGKKNRNWFDLLQLPFSVFFSAALEWFGRLFSFQFSHFWQNFLLLLGATLLVGIGAAITVDMRLVPNPPDGMMYAISERTGKDLGLIKNIIDAICVCISLVLDLTSSGKLVSVGIGTVVGMIFLGRIIYLFNRLFRKKMEILAGISA